jgi:hypothetical protein
MTITAKQKEELLNTLIEMCLEDTAVLENRLIDLIDLKGDELYSVYVTE